MMSIRKITLGNISPQFSFYTMKMSLVLISNFLPNLRERNLIKVELGPSAIFRNISMCLWPTFTNGDKAIRPLEPWAIASGTNSTSCFISLLLQT